jgi:hypothetical protein
LGQQLAEQLGEWLVQQLVFWLVVEKELLLAPVLVVEKEYPLVNE